MPHHRGAVLSAVASGALFGTAGTAAAFAPVTASPLGIGWVRIAGGALVLTVVTGLAGRRLGEIGSAVRRPLLWVAAAGAAGYQVCFFAATRNASVALATLVAVGSAPLFSGLLGRLTLGHRLPRIWYAATAVALSGLVVDSWSGITEGALGPAVGLGVLLAIGSGVSIATYTVAATRLMEDGLGQLPLTAAAYLVGAALLVPVAMTQPRAWLAEPSGVAVGVYLAVATMALANLFYLRGLARLRPGPTATLTLMDPVVAGLLGVLVLRERPAGAAYLGFALVLVGLGVQAWASATRGEEPLPAVG